NSVCQGGNNNGKFCSVDATLTVAQGLGNKIYPLSRHCPPDPATFVGGLDIRLPVSTATGSLAGPTPCKAKPGEPAGIPVHDDNCNPEGNCGVNNCTGNACVAGVTEPSTGAPICQDSKGGLSQNCCNNDTTLPCFPTHTGSLMRTGKVAPPSPPFPDQTYPK